MNILNLIPVKASMLQQQYWLNQKLFPETSAYNIPSVFKINGNLNLIAFEKSIRKIIERHEIFRTIFSSTDEGFCQFILPEVHIPLELRDINDDEADNAINSYINEPFNLEKGPILKTCLFKINESEGFLVILMHHIITDLRTKNIFSAEFSVLYNAYINGENPQLREPSFQYRDYTVQHNEWMKSSEFETMLASWKETLKNVEDLVEFPTDKKRPKALTLNGSRTYFDIPAQLTENLKKIAARETVNLFAVTLTAYALLLHRYSGQNMFAIGVPLTNRRKEGYQDVAGCFVNIMPVVVDFSSDPTLHELLVQIRKAMLSAHRIQEVPYEAIVHATGKPRDTSVNPVFQVGFTYEPPMELTLNGITCEPYQYRIEGSRLEQFLVLWENENSLKGYLEFSSDLFEKDSIGRILKNYIQILRNIPDMMNVKTSMVPVIGDEEKQKILYDWNKTDYPYPGDQCIHRLFEQQAEKNPDHTALVYNDGRMTYDELNKKANQLAHYLVKKGVKVEDNVGIFLERSPDMMVAVFAVLKAGAVYVPIDLNFPPDRIKYMVEDARLKVVLTRKSLKENFPAEIEQIAVDEDWTDITSENWNNPETAVHSHNLAYIIYTSGSTGKPKGVMIEHHSVVNFIYWRQRMYPLSTEDTIMLKTPTIFDISVLELFWWAFFGAKLCVLEPEGEKFPDKIISAVDKFQVRFMQFVPSMFIAFLEYANHEAAVRKLTSLRYISTIGEPLAPSTVNLFNNILHKTNGTRLINTYGPTETTVEVSYFECTSDEDVEIVPIGRPMDNIKLYVVDKNLNPQPVGVKGELLIGGVGTARGYYNRPELTAEKFLPDTFNEKSLFKVYKTGDMARYLPDGNIEFIGRVDFQVKIRGYRIELGEIESVIRNSRLVKDTVVMANDKTAGEKQLIAYIIPDSSMENVREKLQKLMKEKLPDYMVPSVIIQLDEFPSLPNGKLDRKALPKPEADTAATQGITLPNSIIEEKLAEIWKEVLKTESIGIDNNFFDAGGNSLLLIQTASRIREKLHRPVEVFKLFQYPTIRLFAGYLSEISEKTDLSEIGIRMQKKRVSIAQRKNTFNMDKT